MFTPPSMTPRASRRCPSSRASITYRSRRQSPATSTCWTSTPRARRRSMATVSVAASTYPHGRGRVRAARSGDAERHATSRRRSAPVCASRNPIVCVVGRNSASTTSEPVQAAAATSSPAARARETSCGPSRAALSIAAIAAVTCAWTRRAKCARPIPTPRVSTSRLTACRSPFTLRPVSGCTPPIDTTLSSGSCEVVWYVNISCPARAIARRTGCSNSVSASLVIAGWRLPTVAG